MTTAEVVDRIPYVLLCSRHCQYRSGDQESHSHVEEGEVAEQAISPAGQAFVHVSLHGLEQ